MAQSILRLPAVIDRVGYKRSSIWNMIRAGKFPEPIPLGPRLKGWDSDEIDKWVAQRIEAGRANRNAARTPLSDAATAA